MKSVFINELKISFTIQKCQDETAHPEVSGYEEMTNFVRELLAGHITQDKCLHHPSPEKLFQEFAQHFVLLEAAGGVVNDEQHRFLFIKRFGLWDLPKGKVEEGESFAEAALREVIEETGVQQLNILHALPDTYHIYIEKGQNILKCTHWYAMQASGNKVLIPQTKEQITEACWLSAAESAAAIRTSYRSLSDTLGHCFG